MHSNLYHHAAEGLGRLSISQFLSLDFLKCAKFQSQILNDIDKVLNHCSNALCF